MKNISIKIDDIVVRDPHIVSDHFNTFFIPSSNEIVSQVPPTIMKSKMKCLQQSMYLAPFTINEMFSIFNKIKNKNSVGPDDLTVSIVKEFGIYLTEILTSLVNISFTEGIFPEILKTSAVVPIFKKGDLAVASNYRPIALTSVISMIIEYCMLDRSSVFLEIFNLINYLAWLSKIQIDDNCFN